MSSVSEAYDLRGPNEGRPGAEAKRVWRAG